MIVYLGNAIFWGTLAAGGGFILGFWVGAKQEAWYWAHHGKYGGSVFHKGQFFTVRREGE